MVRTYSYKNAFTMIELIFAIVVVAISVMSLPMMSQITSRGIENNILQEAIFAASVQLNEAKTYTWDEYSTEDMNISVLARIVRTDAADCNFGGRRFGNVDRGSSVLNRECLDNVNTRPYDRSSTNGNSIDSIAHTTQKFIEGSGPSATGYKDDYNSSLSVTRTIAGNTYVPLNSTQGTNPDLKQLEYRIFASDSKQTIVLLRAYSANIGEIEPYGVPIP